MINVLRNTVLACLSSVLFALSHASDALIGISLYDIVFVSGNAVDLGDLAEIEGPLNAVNHLKAIELVFTLKSGVLNEISIADIREVIPENIACNFRGARRTYITIWEGICESGLLLPVLQRRYADLAGDTLSVRVRMKDVQVQLRGLDAPPIKFVMLDDETINPGQQIVSFVSVDGNSKVNRHHIKVQIEVSGLLTFPVTVIKRGQVIERVDLECRTVELKSKHISNAVLKPECIVGLEAARYLSPESPIRWDQVAVPPAIRKGAGVEVVLETNSFAVKATAEALESGRVGEEIWVRVQNNGKRMRVLVVSEDQVTLIH